jgi:spore germination protein KB
MPVNFKISPRQFMILVLLYSVGTAILLTPAPLASFAKQDAWLAAILGTGIGLMFVWLYIKVGHLFPDLSLDQVIEKVFGKWLGKLINFTFFLWAFSTAAEIIFIVGDFIKTYWMPETPIVALNILFAMIVIQAARLGAETFARTAEMLFVLFLFLLITLIVFISPQVDVQNIQPVLEKGIKPVIHASLYYMGIFSLSPVMFLMIFPSCVIHRKAAGKAFYIGTLLGGIILITVILLNILVLGPDFVARNNAPSYALSKKINIGGFLTRIEAILAFTWIITTYIRSVMYFHVSVVVFANLFEIKDHRSLIAPLGMLMIVLSLILFPNVQYVANFNKEIWLFYALTYGFILPLLLLFTAKIRNAFEVPLPK